MAHIGIESDADDIIVIAYLEEQKYRMSSALAFCAALLILKRGRAYYRDNNMLTHRQRGLRL